MKSEVEKSKWKLVLVLVIAMSALGMTKTLDGESVERLLTIIAGFTIGKYV